MKFNGHLITDLETQQYDAEEKSYTFFITINPNNVSGVDPECERRLDDFCAMATTDPLFMISFLNDITNGKENPPKVDPGMIKEVQIHARPEVGDKMHRYHYHMIFAVTHRTGKVYMDLDLFRRVLKGYVCPGCYMNVRASRNDMVSLLRYVHKR